MATSNRIRALNRLPFDFQDGLKVGGVDVTNLNQAFTPAGAGLIGFTPVGNLAAGNVQAALAELDSEKVGFARLDDTDGSSLVGYDGGTVQDVMDSAKPMADYVALRAYTGRATSVRITSNGLSGFFYYDAADTTSLDNGGTIIVAGNGKRWKRLFDGAANVKWFGAKGNGALDDTVAVQAAHAASRQVHYPPGRYKVTMANNAALVTFTSQTDIRITSDAAVIYDPRAYTGDPFAPVFDFVGCKDVAVDLNYEGAVLSDLSQNGTLGATFIRWRNGGDGLEVKANLKNCRYGILSGSYTDFSQGNNKNIKADLVTDEVGYPVAFYWVSGVDINIVSQGAHRSAYLAGVSDGKVISRWRNQRVADVHVLLTDAIVGTSSLRGCSNLYVRSTDLGSTIYGTANACVGIANSRQTSAITHENLDLGFFVRSDDVISTKVVGFKCFSGTLPGGEPYYWEPTTVLRNIKVSGTVDRTGQTLAGGTVGEVFWDTTHTGTHTATVSNIVFQDICIVPSPIDTNDLVFEATGLQDAVTFQNVVVSSGSVGLGLATAPGTRICLRDSKFPELVSRGSIGQLLIENSNCGVVPAVLTVSGTGVSGSEVNGAGMTLRYKETTLTLSGASTTWALAIPLGAVVMGCVSRIMTDITGATGYLLGIGSDTSRWANVNNLAAGLATSPNNYGAAALSPQIYQTNTSIVVTAKTSDFTGGTLKVCLYYFDTTGPTS